MTRRRSITNEGRLTGSHLEGYVARGVGAAREQRAWRAARAVQ